MKYVNLPPDKKIDKYAYNHQALLGSGTYGKVYLGKTYGKNDLVAIKCLDNKDISSNYMKTALENEIKIMRKLKSSFIVELYDVLVTSNHTYLVQEFCNEGDYRKFLAKKGAIPEPEALKYITELILGCKELYSMKIMHRDLKPENCLLNNGVLKLADFGFSKLLDEPNQMLDTTLGTPLYMSPQILKGGKYNNKSDV